MEEGDLWLEFVSFKHKGDRSGRGKSLTVQVAFPGEFGDGLGELLPGISASFGATKTSWVFTSAFIFGQVSGILVKSSLGRIYSREGTGEGLLLELEGGKFFPKIYWSVIGDG